MTAAYPWERPLGARVLDHDRVEFRVWAPRAGAIALSLAGRELELEDAGYGVYEVVAPAGAGDDYFFLVEGQELPDPCSGWQPHGLRGPSRIVSAAQRPAGFQAPALADLVIYELHVGTFTAEGTFDGAIAHLHELSELGVTAIEIMPVAEFPGQRGWGYDGVYISAPQSSYGGPEGLARLVAGAHGADLAVILDVVYNHLGASGVIAMEAFGPYFTGKYETPWGKAINYDDADCDPVREWVCQSATGWVRDFGIDGLRLDALHAIFDSSAEHIVAAVARRVHAVNPQAYVIAESGLNDPIVMRPRERGGHACDAAWADDFHHSLRTLLTDERDGYYADFGRVAQLAKALHRPYVDNGSYSHFRRRRFGAPAEDVAPRRFVVFSQNHDQVGNRALGDRMPAAARPLAAFCTLLAPFIPLLFMGEEYGEPAPFQFFSDHIDKEIALATREGRRREFAGFAQPDDAGAAQSGEAGSRAGGWPAAEQAPDPQDAATFRRSKLTRRRDPAIARLYEQLLPARRRLTPGEAEAIEFDEAQRWLRFRRGRYEIVANFGSGRLELACGGGVIELATHAGSRLADGYLKLPPMSGALIR